MLDLNNYLNKDKKTGIDLNKYTSPKQEFNNPRIQKALNRQTEPPDVKEFKFVESKADDILSKISDSFKIETESKTDTERPDTSFYKEPYEDEGINVKAIWDRAALNTIDNLTGISPQEQAEFTRTEMPTTGNKKADILSDTAGQTIGSLTKLFSVSHGVSAGLNTPGLQLSTKLAKLPAAAQRALKTGTTFTGVQAINDIVDDDTEGRPRDYLESFLGGMAVGGAGQATAEMFRNFTTSVPIKDSVYPFVEKIVAGVGAGAGRTSVQKAFNPEEVDMKDLGINMATLAAFYTVPLMFDKGQQQDIISARNYLQNQKNSLDQQTLTALQKLGLDKTATEQQVKQAWQAQKARTTKGDLSNLSETDKLNFLSSTKQAEQAAMNYVKDMPVSQQIKNTMFKNLNKITNSIRNIFTSAPKGGALIPSTPQYSSYPATSGFAGTSPAPSVPEEGGDIESLQDKQQRRIDIARERKATTKDEGIIQLGGEQGIVSEYEGSTPEELLKVREGLIREFETTEDSDAYQELKTVENMLDEKGIEYESKESILGKETTTEQETPEEVKIEMQGNTLSTINKFSDVEQRFNEKFDAEGNPDVWIMKNPNKTGGAYQVRFPGRKKIYDYRARNLTELAEKIGLLSEDEEALVKSSRLKTADYEIEDTGLDTSDWNIDRGEKVEPESNVGYHAGDLGKAESLANMEAGRGTGHYGTGVYFVGSEDKLNYEKSSYAERPMHEVKFENYELFRPRNWEQGKDLHDFLRDINRYAEQGEFAQEDEPLSESRYKPYKDELIERKDQLFPNMSDQEFLNKLDELNRYVQEQREKPRTELRKERPDSASTRFMKEMGYEGIDVRGIEGLDNTEFGSVIYDLHAEDATEKSYGVELSDEDEDFFKIKSAEELVKDSLNNVIESLNFEQNPKIEDMNNEQIQSAYDHIAYKYGELLNNIIEGKNVSPKYKEVIRKDYERIKNIAKKMGINLRLNNFADKRANEMSNDIANLQVGKLPKTKAEINRVNSEQNNNVQTTNEKEVDTKSNKGFANPFKTIKPSKPLNDLSQEEAVSIRDRLQEKLAAVENNTEEATVNSPEVVQSDLDIINSHIESAYDTDIAEQGTETATEETESEVETTGIDVNSATIDDLTTIKGIGASTAQNIINYRDSKENGIESLDELKEVKGIGQSTFDKISGELTAKEMTETTDSTETVEEPKDIDSETTEAAEEAETEAKEMDTEKIAREVTGETAKTGDLLSDEARELMELEDIDIREYLDTVHLTSLEDLQMLSDMEMESFLEEIAIDDPYVAEAIEAELEEIAYEGTDTFYNVVQNISNKTDTGIDLTDVDRVMQTTRVKNQQLANRLQLDEIREEAVAQAYNIALEMDTEIKSEDLDSEGSESQLVMGYYAETADGEKKIGLRDIVDMETLGHEVGHMVDYALFGRLEGRNLTARLNDENLLNLLNKRVENYNEIDQETLENLNEEIENLEAAIRGEMGVISRTLIRPSQNEALDYESYRLTPEEMTADFWVAYITNHALTYDMAPNATKMYDFALSKLENKNLSNLVKSIRETLQQTSDTPQLEFNMITPEMAANLNPDKTLDITTQAEKITAGADALIQEQKSYARLDVSDWARVIPENLQEDIVFYIEGTDNPVKNKSFEQIKQEIESNPEVLQAVREIRFKFEKVRQEWNRILREADSETRINYIENYAPRMWQENENAVKSFYRSYAGSTNPQAAQKRYYPTIAEGMEAGLTPETTNILTLYKDYVDRNSRPIAMNSFKNYLLDLQDENGNPIVLTRQEFEQLRAEGENYSDIEDINSEQFKPTLKEKTRKKRYVSTDSSIITDDYNQRLLVREDVYRYAREHLQKQVLWLKPFTDANNLIKSLNYLFSGFHAFDLVFESGMGGLHFVKNPITLSGNKYFDNILPWQRGMKLASYKPFLRTAIHSGLKINPMEDAFVGKLAEATDYIVEKAEQSWIPGVETGTKVFRTFESKWQDIMWGKLYTGSKLNSFFGVIETRKKILPENPTETQIRAFYEAAADQVNQMYGGQDWSRIAEMSPRARQLAHLAIRAPDWTLSNIKIGARVLSPHIKNLIDYGLTGKPEFQNMTPEQQVKDIRRSIVAAESAKYFTKMVVGITLLMNVLNFATVQRPTWENEGGLSVKFNWDITPIVHKMQETLPFLERDEDDERRYYAMPLKQIREVFNFIANPMQTVGYKLSPFTQIVAEQFFGSQAGSNYDLGFSDERATTTEKLGRRVKRGAKTLMPFTFSGTNFALTLPLRRGISEYRAILEYEDSIEQQMIPSLMNEAFGTARDIESLDREAMHNGLNPLELTEIAISNLKTKYSGMLFDAITEEDTRKAEKAAMALRRLNHYNISDSAEARGVDYEEEMEAIDLMTNPEIAGEVQPLPFEILNPDLRFDDEELEELIMDKQRKVGDSD